jgi:hypothetical protein
MAGFVAASGAGRDSIFLGGFGVMGGSVGFRSGSVVVGDFWGLGYDFLTTHRHQKITLGPLAEAQIFFAGKLGYGRLGGVLSMRATPRQE